MTDCIFCRIVTGQAPAWRVYEDESVLALLDINPIIDGHTLVIPKSHYVNILDIPPDLLEKVTVAAQRLARQYRQALNMEAANFLHSAGRAARQDVFHFHLHIIPRYEGDGLHLGYRPRTANRDSFDRILARIKAAQQDAADDANR
jgi:histidine triad (HIT) family protein